MAETTVPPATPKPGSSAHGDEAKTPEWKSLVELSSAQFGGRVLFATDDWFAVADNMIMPHDPVFIPGKFTEFGKWMDGWESRRKRIPGHDWAIVRLGLPGTIAGIEVSTAFFTGNFSPRVSIQGACIDDSDAHGSVLMTALDRTRGEHGVMGSAATPEQLKAAEALKSAEWKTLVPFTKLGAGYRETHRNFFDVRDSGRITHIRVNMFPDGGIARVRVHGTMQRDWSTVGRTAVVDLAATTNGGQVLAVNDSHYGHHSNLIAPNRGVNMGDGWETRRRMDRPAVLKPNADGLLQMPDFDWCVVKLGHAGYVHEFEVDTNHFKGNFPESCLVQGIHAPDARDADFSNGEPPRGHTWTTILKRTRLGPHAQHRFKVAAATPVSHLRLLIFPDGGVSRLRAFGTLGPVSKL